MYETVRLSVMTEVILKISFSPPTLSKLFPMLVPSFPVDISYSDVSETIVVSSLKKVYSM